MFGNFAKEKSDFLRKKDKSKKGTVDEDIKEIVNVINSKQDYYTTSSCSGRIVLLEMKSKRKYECNWIFTKHNKVNFDEIYNALKKYNKNNQKNRELPLKESRKEETCFDGTPYSVKYIGEASRYGGKATPSTRIGEARLNNYSRTNNEYQIWFKQQPIILHVACRNLDAANKLLKTSRKIYRRAGIIGVTNRKVMIEIIGDERIETIIADKNFVAGESYIKQLVKYANENFMDNKRKSEKLVKLLKKNYKMKC